MGSLAVNGDLTIEGYADVAEQTAPATPTSGHMRVYAKSDGKLYAKNDAGTEYDLTATGSGTVAVTEVEVDFGSTPLYVKTFSVADASVTTSSKIVVHHSYAAATDKDQDENEMDGLICAATCTVNGTIDIVARAHPGPVVGKFKLNYLVG